MAENNPSVKLKSKQEALARLRDWRKTLAARTEELEPGRSMPDGSIYVGISPDTAKPMYAMPTDASQTLDFDEAAAYAADLNKKKTLDHDDWRLPSIGELRILFGEKNTGALSGTFNYEARRPWNTSNMYWSSSRRDGRFDERIYCLTFNGTGTPTTWGPNGLLSVRCIR